MIGEETKDIKKTKKIKKKTINFKNFIKLFLNKNLTISFYLIKN